MRFAGMPDRPHGRPPRIGVLITNLGTPDAPTKKALRAYLKEFLWDPRVVEIPRPLWWLILHGIILNTRPAKSAASYASVWTDEGSPLLAISEKQQRGILARLQRDWGDAVVGALAMRYGNPSIPQALRELRDAGAERLIVLPMYPQYSGATVGSTFDAIAAVLQRERWTPELHFVSGYDTDPGYIDALAASLREHWSNHDAGEKLLFSFHGVPKRYLLAGDPYHCFCHRTARLVAERLHLPQDRWMVTFQSRFGRAEWLKPYTDATLKALPKQGIHSVDVVCPGFAADCLETIEEIGVENREYFEHAGGHRFAYIPALNDRSDHLDAMTELLGRHIAAWRGDQYRAEAGAERAPQQAADVAAARGITLPAARDAAR